MSEIRDGLSNTIFFGEVLPMSSWHNGHGWATSNNGSGYCSTVVPINFDTSSRESSGDGCHRYCNYNTAEGFKSSHPGGANFAFGDGSVHFLPETIDHQSYQYLGAKADAQPVSTSY
jgi:prepilin-type processing-associated H-X9-DG protein